MINPKNKLTLLLFFTSSLIGFWFLSGGIGPDSGFETKKRHVLLKKETADKALLRTPGSAPQSTGNPVAQTAAGPVWKDQVEKALLAQGAGTVKSASVEKVDSFQWKMQHGEIPVDSVIVRLEHVKGHRSTFRALVDSSNGKILQTWDHPVIDNFRGRHSAGIKVDPRYHND